VPYRVQLDGLQILWLLANPLWTHGSESGSKTITGWLLMGATAANHIWWLNINPPQADLLLHLNSYRIRHLPFGFLTASEFQSRSTCLIKK